jgi:hypothetical protein
MIYFTISKLVEFLSSIKVWLLYLLCFTLCFKVLFKMENNDNTAEDLKTIRKMMEESTRFLSLSGLSGIFAGLFASAGALIAWFVILNQGAISYEKALEVFTGSDTASIGWLLITDALAVLFLSIAFSLQLSVKKARTKGKSLWTPVSKRLLINLIIPLVSGGLFIITLLVQGQTLLVIPGLLIFYGLALVSAGKFTYGEVFYLGLLEIITGLFAAFIPAAGIIFWMIGFGLLHVIYGIFMYRKYEA